MLSYASNVGGTKNDSNARHRKGGSMKRLARLVSIPSSPCPTMTGGSKPEHARTSPELQKLPPLFS